MLFSKLVFYFLMFISKWMGPSFAKRIVVVGLKSDIFQRPKGVSRRLQTKLLGKTLATPLGLSSEFDKNGSVLGYFLPLGISFGEFGSYTLLPEGIKEKSYFLPKFKSIRINAPRCANPGIAKAVQVLASRRRMSMPVGVSLISFGSDGEAYVSGVSAQASTNVYSYNTEYHQMAMKVAPYADYVVLNFSHPSMALAQMLADETLLLPILLDIKGALRVAAPINPPKMLVKVPYDLSELEVKQIAQTSQKAGVDGIIVAGPAQMNRQLRSLLGKLSGSYSEDAFVTGDLLKKDMMRLVKRFYLETEGKMDIIAAGGVFTVRDVYEAIAYGASAVQLGTVLLYKGPEIITKLNKQLGLLLEKEKQTIATLRGSRVDLEDHIEQEHKKEQVNHPEMFVD